MRYAADVRRIEGKEAQMNTVVISVEFSTPVVREDALAFAESVEGEIAKLLAIAGRVQGIDLNWHGAVVEVEQ